MVWWLLKKRNKENIEFHDTVKNSFTNLRDDMAHISKWINHFKDKHEDHNTHITNIFSRLNLIESDLIELKELGMIKQAVVETSQKEPSLEENESSDDKAFEKWDELTPVQQSLCWKISRLQKERPKKWLSIKEIAAELYPDREYSKVRSTVSDYIGLLEDFDYLERKRKGRQAYVRFKKNNLPETKESSKIKIYDKE
ncbi:MAG: hypothetical protein Q8Q35_04505 [Nanoarchaeota archaeon]|nr:hypothetical protein [Nanoarchaeota archaeon]